jgi:hypothetical protein
MRERAVVTGSDRPVDLRVAPTQIFRVVARIVTAARPSDSALTLLTVLPWSSTVATAATFVPSSTAR